MGLNKMLAQGIGNEEDLLSKAKKTSVKPSRPNVQAEPVKKNKGGRPKNSEAGLFSRKQYTLTLVEDDYKDFLSRARAQGISFAKFMENAAKYYIASLDNND